MLRTRKAVCGCDGLRSRRPRVRLWWSSLAATSCAVAMVY